MIVNKEKEKLQSVTDDMKNIINNIQVGRVSIDKVKTTLEMMVKECEDVLSK